MSLVLSVDGDRWRAHLRSVAEANPGLVPVVKGNGYGFTPGRLARRAHWLGVDTIAVGTYDELPHVASRFPGDLLVMTPWRPFGAALTLAETLPAEAVRRIVHTVSRVEDLAALLAHQPGARYVLELVTSMQRHGMTARELWSLTGSGGSPGRATRSGLAGISFHLPLTAGSHLSQAQRLVNDVVGAELPPTPGARSIWVSHLTLAELAQLRAAYPEFSVRPRIGTGLWLGDREALHVGATVTDVHPLERGDSYGYRGRTAPRAGHLLVVSGGTAHGIGLEAPTGDLGLRARATTLARGGLDAVGFVRSPFSIDGIARLFAEPPHMQSSMLFLPAGARVPGIGESVDVRVRYTATAFDRVEIS